MAHVLLIHAELCAVTRRRDVLRQAGYSVETAASGIDGLKRAQANSPDVVVLPSTLPDMDGIDALRQIRSHQCSFAFIVTSSSQSVSSVVAAMRLGARDWLEEPVGEAILLDAVHRTVNDLMAARLMNLARVEPHALARLVEKAVLFIRSAHDEPTLTGIGRAVGISAAGLRNWCRTAQIRPRAFRQFARGLRAVYRHEHDSKLGVENLLKIVDRRTLEKFLVSSGGSSETLPATIDRFVERQRFITDAHAIATVRRALSDFGATDAPIGTH
jgi:CheY-like chemotaxis protein